MARSTVRQPRPAELSANDIQLGLSRIAKRVAEVEQFDPGKIREDDPASVLPGLDASIDEALVRTFGPDTIEYDRYKPAGDFQMAFYGGGQQSHRELQQSLARQRQRAIDLLAQAQAALRERLEELQAVVDERGSQRDGVQGAAERRAAEANRKVFIVHGHDSGPKDAVARYLAKLGFDPVILHEKPNMGRTVIEKFEANADVGFAVVLLTPDDVGGLKGAEQNPRARQNVILELGFFVGSLGRERVCALKVGNVELPSDILGVVWIDLDANSGWQTTLGRELQAVGYEIDWNRLMRS